MKRLIHPAIFFFTFISEAQVSFMLESGAVWQHRNDVQIPSDTGTRLDFDSFDRGPFFHYRGELFWKINEKHNLRAVYAPFQIQVKGPISSNVQFDGETFTPNEELEIDYKFNSYRLTYFYSFWEEERSHFNLGLTGKIRDAKIRFSQSGQSESYDNIGFVPLVYVEYQTPITSLWHFNVNMDAAAASQGRAIDLAIKFRRLITDQYSLGVGARTLEGGADNSKVFTFSWLNYAVVDLVGEF